LKYKYDAPGTKQEGKKLNYYPGERHRERHQNVVYKTFLLEKSSVPGAPGMGTEEPE
jgi:hypothetical protein